MTENQNQVLEEQEKETQRFLELNTKEERTEEEDAELEELKSNYGKKVQKKFGEYHYQLKRDQEL